MANLHVLTDGEKIPHPPIRDIKTGDIQEALRRGYSDFKATPTHVFFLGLIYPVVGAFFAALAFGYNVYPLLFPLAAGFALVGPIAAVGLYEISRRREAGMEAGGLHFFDVLKSPALPAIAAVSLVLMMLFVAWIVAAHAIYVATMGPGQPVDLVQFFRDVLTTKQGWTLIVVGNLVGLLFAIAALAIGVVSFPLLLDRDVGAVSAIQTSLRAVTANPVNMTKWGIVVVALLVVGALPLFVGLAVVMPLLGHATWHFYRRVVGR